MGSSIVNYKEQNFWLPDTSFEILMSYISELIETDTNYYNQDWLKEMNDYWLIAKTGGFHGLINFAFDDFLINHERVLTFDKILQKTIEKMISMKELTNQEIINRQNSNQYDPNANWHKDLFPISTEGYVNQLELIRDVIRQRLDKKYQGKTVYNHGFIGR